MVQQKPTKETEIEKLITLGPGGLHGKASRGHRGKSRQDVGHTPLLGSMCGALWGCWAKPGLLDSNKNNRGFGKLRGGLI